MGAGDLCRVPPVAVYYGRDRQMSEKEPCGYCRRVLWAPSSGLMCPFPLWGSIKRIFPSGCQAPTRGSELRLTPWRPRRVLYPGFLDKTNFPRILTRLGPVPTGPFYNTHTVPSLNFAWLSRGVPLLGHPAQVSCAHFPPGAR